MIVGLFQCLKIYALGIVGKINSSLKEIFYWQKKEVTKNMTRYQGLTANQMAGRILHREDNTYKKEIIKRVLDMYADEIYKAMLVVRGYRYRE